MKSVERKRPAYKLMTPDERLWSRVDKNGPTVPHVGTPCWLWTGNKNPAGYGMIMLDGKVIGAHRASVLLSGRAIPDGLWVLHQCDTPACVNPAHLFLGTCQDNVDDKVSKGRHAHGDAHRAACAAGPHRPSSGDANGSRLHPELLKRGEAHHKAKLTEADVREIRRLYAGGGHTIVRLGERFGVSFATISRIILRNIWAHVKDEDAA